MTPIGIWSIVKATLMLVTAPVPSVDASEVTTRKVIWLAPRPTARGAISTSALRAWSSPRSMRAVQRNPSRCSGRAWMRRCPMAPATTPMARPVTPIERPRMSAEPMIARL